MSLHTSFGLTIPTPSAPHGTVVISESSMEETYDILANRLRETVLKSLPEGEQYWVAIAGGPGSGKTTTANQVAKRLNIDSNQECCVVLPMDGFHYSKQELKELDPPNGDTYMKRRGAPWTMNSDLCYQLLSKAKENKSGQLPTYCRQTSDPIPDGVILCRHHRIVLVEGLYLLWADDSKWAPLQTLWDEKWFVKCPNRHEQRERLIQRSLENWSEKKIQDWGPGREGAVAKVDTIDGPNMDIVAPSERYANVVIESMSR